MVCYLYRHFDEDDMLLYVGISNNVFKRISGHKNDSHWFNDIATITIDPRRFASRKDALIAEKEAIKKEKPLYNKVHNEDSYCYMPCAEEIWGYCEGTWLCSYEDPGKLMYSLATGKGWIEWSCPPANLDYGCRIMSQDVLEEWIGRLFRMHTEQYQCPINDYWKANDDTYHVGSLEVWPGDDGEVDGVVMWEGCVPQDRIRCTIPLSMDWIDELENCKDCFGSAPSPIMFFPPTSFGQDCLTNSLWSQMSQQAFHHR